MDRAAYSSMSAQEADHWWFVARRAIIADLIEKHVPLGPEARILEAGCGTGGNLAMLAQYGQLDALEYDADARALAGAHGIGHVAAGALPVAIGFGTTAYNMIALLDVLEHIDDDVASLKALGGRLAENGSMLVTVPAVPWLWSDHDALHHHKRRYTREGFGQVVADAGLTIRTGGYFNSLLFPLALVQRVTHQLFSRTAPLDARPPDAVNSLLRTIFTAERHLIDHIRFPIGLSLYAVLTR